ncbi:MAG: DUF1828 domain-containing protein [Deltaproteobacteria bacterium]|nr:DUF1828 domain-containing protein [Deltaproteobacteria bacterium]
MRVETIQADFRRKVGETVRLEEEGIDRYRVFTPFLFEDGDHLAIVVKRERNRWIVADEGHTYMHLTYDLDEKDLQRGNRAKLIANALSAFGVEDQEGELRIEIPEERYGDALFSFVQALLKVSDVTFLSRERVRSTFMEDFRSFVEATVPADRRVFDWSDPDHDPESKYTVDCRINGLPKPIMVYALPSDDRVRDATISLLQLERWNVPHRSVAIFEDQEEVNRKVLARFSDMCEKQFSSLGANRDRIALYVQEALRL